MRLRTSSDESSSWRHSPRAHPMGRWWRFRHRSGAQPGLCRRRHPGACSPAGADCARGTGRNDRAAVGGGDRVDRVGDRAGHRGQYSEQRRGEAHASADTPESGSEQQTEHAQRAGEQDQRAQPRLPARRALEQGICPAGACADRERSHEACAEGLAARPDIAAPIATSAPIAGASATV